MNKTPVETTEGEEGEVRMALTLEPTHQVASHCNKLGPNN